MQRLRKMWYNRLIKEIHMCENCIPYNVEPKEEVTGTTQVDTTTVNVSQPIAPTPATTPVAVVEKFSFKKFFGGLLNLFNPVLWAKDIVGVFNIRKIIIYGVLIGLGLGLYFYGHIEGRKKAPVVVDLGGYGKESWLKLDAGRVLHIDSKGHAFITDVKGKVIKQLTAEDAPDLFKTLSPLGIEIKPFAVGGYGAGTNGEPGFEGGVGVSWLRAWEFRLDTFLTQKGYYGGVSYKLDRIKMKNSSIGLAIGKGWDYYQTDTRAMVYFKIDF